MNHTDTLKQAGLVYVRKFYPGLHILKEVETGKLEVWGNSKGYSGYRLRFKNTHLEFVRSIERDSPIYNENIVQGGK